MAVPTPRGRCVRTCAMPAKTLSSAPHCPPHAGNGSCFRCPTAAHAQGLNGKQVRRRTRGDRPVPFHDQACAAPATVSRRKTHQDATGPRRSGKAMRRSGWLSMPPEQSASPDTGLNRNWRECAAGSGNRRAGIGVRVHAPWRGTPAVLFRTKRAFEGSSRVFPSCSSTSPLIAD